MKKKQTLCVAYAADNNYAKLLGISMLSLFEANKDFTQIDIFVLDCGIGLENKNKLNSIVEKYERKISFVIMKDFVSSLDLKMGARKISIASYGRLFLTSVIPKSYNKILYLDCDTIVLGDLHKLWNINIEKYMLAGVRDTVDKYFLKSIGLKQEDYYVNAGIMLVNLENWRKYNLQERFLSFIERFKGNVPHHDQGTINAVCNKKIYILPPNYNVTSNIYTFSAKTVKRIYLMKDFYSQKELDDAKDKPIILHFTTGLVGRPWEENCSNPMKSKYNKFADISPWPNEPLLPDSRGLAVKVFSVFYRHAPLFLSELLYKSGNWLFHLRD